MKAYWFKFVDEDEIPTGRIGLVVGVDDKDIFWKIDELGDPFSVLLYPTTEGCFCHTQKLVAYPEDESEVVDVDGTLEVGEGVPDWTEEDGWEVPIWCEDEKVAESMYEA